MVKLLTHGDKLGNEVRTRSMHSNETSGMKRYLYVCSPEAPKEDDRQEQMFHCGMMINI